MGTPQVIFLCLCAMSVGISMAKHGERRENYNAWTSLFAAAIEIGILWWGGFFNG